MLLYVCTHVCMYVCIHAYADIDYMRRYKYVYRAPGPVTEERRRAAGGGAVEGRREASIES